MLCWSRYLCSFQVMKLPFVFVLGFWLVVDAHNVIQGFHFHTYFFQNNEKHQEEVRSLRQIIEREIKTGILGNCSLNHLNSGPVGPHTIGSFETCCNVSSVGHGVSFFMQNRGKFSILLHPLTTSEMKDHSERAFWLGQKLPLDLATLSHKLHETPICPVYGNMSGVF